MSEWLKEHAWKACVLQKSTVGSNPTLSANQKCPQRGVFILKRYLFNYYDDLAEKLKQNFTRVNKKRNKISILEGLISFLSCKILLHLVLIFAMTRKLTFIFRATLSTSHKKL